jgi:small acid-soluble spore protein A (major alpha-type SASP)
MGSQGQKDNGNDLLVPEAKGALERMRNEIAGELSLPVPNGDYWGNVPSKDCGRVGGLIGGKMVRDLVRMAEEQLKGK